MDALGAEERLKGPVRDLASQPLFLQALRQSGASQRSSLAALQQQLAHTYSPAVLAELLDLLEAVTGRALPDGPTAAACTPPATTSPPKAGTPAASLRDQLQALAPGVAAAAGAALLWALLGQELERLLIGPWGWSAGVALALTLALLQALSLGPLRLIQRRWPLRSAEASDPHQAWRWITAPWWHANRAEAATNLVLLLIVLGATPLPLGQVLLRYGLTALATQAPAALAAEHFSVSRQWSGAAGPLSALVGLAAGMSLLQGRSLGFELGAVTLPAWVVLLVYGALQLGWQLPRQDPNETSQPWQRLLASTCSWGLLLGLGWGLISWLQQLLAQR